MFTKAWIMSNYAMHITGHRTVDKSIFIICNTIGDNWNCFTHNLSVYSCFMP